MGVSDTVHVRARGVNGSVDHDASPVYGVKRAPNDVTVEVYFDEFGGCDFAVMEAVGVY
jgi:hypothetical protein